MKLRSYTILCDPAPEPSGGGKPADPPAAPATDPARAILKQHGNDAAAAVRAVLGDRDGIAKERDELKAKLPKDGHRVIDPDTAKALDEFTALGLKPEQ